MEWYVLALISALFTAFGAIVEKKTLMKEHAMEFSAVFSILILIFSIPFIFIRNMSITQTQFVAIYIVSILSTIAFWLYAKSMRHMEISASSPLLAFSPAIVVILSFIFLGENVTLFNAAGIGFLLIGSYILQINHKKSSLLEPFRTMLKSKYVHYILFALLLTGFSVVIVRSILNETNYGALDPLVFLFYVALFVAINSTIMIYVFHDGFKGIKNGFRNNWKWLILLTVITLTHRIAQTIAFSQAAGKAGLISGIQRSSILFATIIGGEIFHEKNLLTKSTAGVLMLIGILLIILL